MLRDKASHIWIGAGSSAARRRNTSARFSPACCRPLRKIAIRRPSRVETMPEVNVPVRCALDFFAESSLASSTAGPG